MLQRVPIWRECYAGGFHGHMWVHVMPENSVCMDFDGPTASYMEGGDLRDLFLNRVRNAAGAFSEKYDLGKYWIIATFSGFHVIFEKKSPYWAKILRDAVNYWLWDSGEVHSMCGGFAEHCMEKEYIELRVGRKFERGWDLEFLTPLDDAPDFVKEHATMIEVLRRLDV